MSYYVEMKIKIFNNENISPEEFIQFIKEFYKCINVPVMDYDIEWLSVNNYYSAEHTVKYNTKYITNINNLWKSHQDFIIDIEINGVRTIFITKPRVVKSGEVYKHFKGNLYIIKDIVLNTETNEQMVVYCNKENKVFVRPLNMFLSKVDKNKYPNVSQFYRFEKVKDNACSYCSNKKPKSITYDIHNNPIKIIENHLNSEEFNTPINYCPICGRLLNN